MLEQRTAFTNPLYVGLSGFLLSPGCSIFAYSPLLLVAMRAQPSFARRHPTEFAASAAVFLTFLLVCSKFAVWTGLWSSPGPRYLFVTTALLMLPVGRWLDERRSRLEWSALGMLAVVGFAIQIVLMAVKWPAVIRLMDYPLFDTTMSFVFVPELSPILGSAAAVGQGLVASRLWELWFGAPGIRGAARHRRARTRVLRGGDGLLRGWSSPEPSSTELTGC